MTTPTTPPPTKPSEAPSAADAYVLLSRPVLELTDAELEVILSDLRRKRETFVASNGKAKDTPGKVKKKPATPEEKQELTKSLLAQLGL